MFNRKPTVGGNWKMNLDRDRIESLVDGLIERIGSDDSVDVILFPPFPYLQCVADRLQAASSSIQVGAQDVSPEPDGAFTGEVSCAMLQDLGVGVALTGHSERRHVIGETDELINAKTRASLDAGLCVILCVGEKLEQREAGQTDSVNIAQLHYGLAGVPAAQMDRVTIAYEPVWAIGTGRTATPQDAQAAHAAIRLGLERLYGSEVSGAVRIQYGGSCKPDNAPSLFGQPDVDGGLIGGASLNAADFAAIVEAAGAKAGVA